MSIAWIALNAVHGLGAVTFSKLLELYGSPEATLNIPATQLVADGVVSEKMAARIHDPKLAEYAREQNERANRLNVTTLTISDPCYPSYLKEIFAPPPVLFARGNLDALQQPSIAIVGSRSPTHYGKHAAKKITEELVSRRFAIISGLARGIDTVAHETTVENGGMTIAVLGCGLDTVYPASNRKLADEIQERGVLISEFPFATPPEPFNFPRRNRIISGCAAAVLVVEASEKSGSLITARYGLQQGREVCAVPGPVNSPLSNGTFSLIRDGATPVRSGHELAESLAVVSLPESILCKTQQKELDMSIFTDEERQIYESLTNEPMGIDAIADIQQKPVADLFVVLLNLELKGLVQQCSGQRFIRV